MNSPEVAIAIAGFIATSLASGLGLFFTYKARTSSYRNRLYERQVTLAEATLEAIARIDALCGVVLAPIEAEARDIARRELQERLAAAGLIGAQGSVLFPKQLLVTFGEYYGAATQVLIAANATQGSPELLTPLRAHSARVMSQARALVGVEELTIETQKIISGRLEKVAQTDPRVFLEIVARTEETDLHREGAG